MNIRIISKKQLWRGIIHIPHGLAAGWLLTSSHPEPSIRIAAAVLYSAYFAFYERNEDTHIKDQAWKDIVGYLPGLFFWFFVRWIVR